MITWPFFGIPRISQSHNSIASKRNLKRTKAPLRINCIEMIPKLTSGVVRSKFCNSQNVQAANGLRQQP